MTTARLQNIAIYVAIGIAIFLLSDLGKAVEDGLLPGFRDGETFAGSRARIGDLIALLAAGGGLWVAANRPRFGSEKLAREVGQLQKDGVSREAMTVVPTEDIELLKAEAARIRRVKPLRDVADADEVLERKAAQRG